MKRIEALPRGEIAASLMSYLGVVVAAALVYTLGFWLLILRIAKRFLDAVPPPQYVFGGIAALVTVGMVIYARWVIRLIGSIRLSLDGAR